MIPSIYRYKLILRSILILECDFRFNFNLKLPVNNVTETTGQIVSARIFLWATDWKIVNSINLQLITLFMMFSPKMNTRRNNLFARRFACSQVIHTCQWPLMSLLWLRFELFGTLPKHRINLSNDNRHIGVNKGETLFGDCVTGDIIVWPF